MIHVYRFNRYSIDFDVVTCSELVTLMFTVLAEAAGLFHRFHEQLCTHTYVDGNLRVQELNMSYMVKMSVRQEYSIDLRLCIEKIGRS
jgi:hypothetical protein